MAQLKILCNPKISEISAFLILLTPFISGLYVSTRLGNLYASYPLLFLGAGIYLAKNCSIQINEKAASLLVLIILYSGACVLKLNNLSASQGTIYDLGESLTKLTLFVTYIFSFLICREICGKSTTKLFIRYTNYSFFFAALGILQSLVFYFFSINIFGFLGSLTKQYGRLLGVSGFSVEPAFYACAILPAACFELIKILDHGKITARAVTLISAILLSTSSLGYLGLMVCSLLVLFRNLHSANIGRLLLIATLLIPAGFKAINTEFFMLRLHDTLRLISTQELTMESGINMSTYSIGVNAAATYEFLTENAGLGAGFGQYYKVYDAYIFNYEQPTYRESIPGRGSGTSLLIRVSGELGIIGIFFLTLFVTKNISFCSKDRLSQINLASFSTIVIILLRMGEYYANGLIFVFCFLYFSSKDKNLMSEDPIQPIPQKPSLESKI